MNQESVETRLKLDSPEQIEFTCDVLRVLRYVIHYMQLEKRKQWTAADIISLIDQIMLEMVQGVTEEDKTRERRLRAGLQAFKQGKARQENPYAADSPEATWWDTGWHDGERAAKKAALKPAPKVTAPASNKPKQRYKIRHQDKSTISEWSAALHMYVNAGGGTLYEEYDEADRLMRTLRQEAKTGIVSLQVIEPSEQATDNGLDLTGSENL